MSDTADILLRIRVDVTNINQIAQLGAALQRAQAQMANMEQAGKKVGKSTGLVMGIFEKFSNRLQNVERKMDAVFRAGVHLQAMGRDLLGLGQKMLGVVGKAADAWGEFEFNLNRAAGAMDVFDNKSAMYQDLKDSIIAMARELRLVDPQTAAKAMYYWQSTTGQTIDTADKLKVAISGVKTAMQVATLTQTDYEQVIKGAYSIMRQYGMSLSDIPAILKDLFVITQRTSLEYGDLIQSFKYTGPIAKLLGGSYKDVAKWLGIIGDLGQRGSMSGRGLGMMFTQLVRPSDKAKAAYNKLFKETMHVKDGYNKLVFPKGKFIGFEKWITLLANSTKGLTQQQKLQYLTTLTGTQNSARIVLPLVEAQTRAIKKGSDIFKESKYSLANSAKVFDKAWGLLSQSWKGTVGLLKQTVMPIFLILGENIARVLTPILNELSAALWDLKPEFEEVAKTVTDAFAPALNEIGKLMQKALKWFKENPKMVKQIATWAAMAVAIGAVIGAIMLGIGTLVFFLNTIVLIVAGMVPMLAGLALLTAAFVTLGTKVYQNVGGIRDALANFINAFIGLFAKINGNGEGLRNTWQTISDAIDKALGIVADWLNKIADWMNKLSPEDAKTLLAIVGALTAMVLLKGPLGTLSLALDGVSASMKVMQGLAGGVSTVTGVLGKLPSILSSIGPMVASLAGTITTALAGMGPIGWVIIGIIAAVAAAFAAYQTNFLGFKDFIDGLVNWFVTNVGPVIGAVFDWLKTNVPIALAAISDFINNVLMPAFNSFVGWLVTTFGPLWEQIGATLAAAGEFFGALGDKVTEVANAIIGWLQSLGINVDVHFNSILDVITTVVGAIALVVGKFLEVLFSIWSNVFQGIFNTVKTIIEGIANALRGFFQIIQGIFEVATGLLTGNWDKVWQGLKNIVDGFATMVKSAINTFFGVLQTIFQTGLNVIDGIFKAIFGEGPDSIYGHIKGFLDTIYKFGSDILTGLAKGIGDMVDWAATQIKGFFGSIIDTVKSFLGIKSPSTLFADIGKNIVKGLWDGISGLGSWLTDKVWNWIKSVIPGPVLDALGIHSPSKVMAAIGENIVLGLAYGIESTTAAYDAMIAQANAIQNAVNLAASNSMQTVLGANINSVTSSDSTREINLNVDVTSSDGAVNNVDLATLSNLITGSDMVRALEMMATVD